VEEVLNCKVDTTRSTTRLFTIRWKRC